MNPLSKNEADTCYRFFRYDRISGGAIVMIMADAADGCRPLIAPHFNLTVELSLKAMVRGNSWTMIPITWRNRKSGTTKFRFKEMDSRYLFICFYVWLEKYFSCGDYRKNE